MFPIGLLADKATVAARLNCVASGRVSGRRLRYLAVSLVLVLLPGLTGVAQAQSDSNGTEEPLYDIDIPQLDAAEALNRFAEQTGAVMLFPYDLAQARMANAVRGRYTLVAALDALLENTGLTGGLSDKRVIQISVSEAGERQDEGGPMRTNKKHALIAVVAGFLTGQGIAQETAVSPEASGENSVVTGEVTDARTGANLKGALVTIEEIGRSTASNDLGQFRFSSVTPGTYTIIVSFLGYGSSSAVVRLAPGDTIQQSFELGGVEEIVVFGQRSARAQSLNLERTAQNSQTVISSDLLGNFNGTTISESLRRVSGIAFEVDPETGDGANVIVRGLEPDLNQVALNGVRLPDTSGFGRSADLSAILTESIESVTVNRTLLPSQDSNGAGALIEIETKGPLDRDRRFANFGIQQAGLENDQLEETLISGTVSGTFGEADDFGASLSIQYRDRETTNIGYRVGTLNPGPYLPAGVSGPSSVFSNDSSWPLDDGRINLFYPSAVNATESTTSDETLSVTASLQKEFGDHSDLRLDLAHTEREGDRFGSSVRFNPIASYAELPVDELGGETRFVYLSESVAAPVPGVNLSLSRSANYLPKQAAETTTISIRGNTVLDAWSFDYGAGYSQGSSETEDQFNLSIGSDLFRDIDQILLADEIRANTTSDGRIVSIYNPLTPESDAFPLPGFSAVGLATFSAPETFRLGQLRTSEGRDGENGRISLNGSVRREFVSSGGLQYIEAGLLYEAAEFDSLGSGLFLERIRPNSGERVSLADLGIALTPGLLTTVGSPHDIGSLSQGDVLTFIQAAPGLVNNGSLRSNSFEGSTEDDRLFNTETDFSGYVEARYDIGNIEIIGGFRFTSVDIETEFFSDAELFDAQGVFVESFREQYSDFIRAEADQFDVLPRVLVNYRPSDNLIVRAGYFETASRPRVDAMVEGGFFSLRLQEIYGPNDDQPLLTVGLANPDLEPAITQNYDASIELYDDKAGVVKLSLFYKSQKNPLRTEQEPLSLAALGSRELPLPNAPEFQNLPANVFIQGSRVVNSDGSADIWGAEISVESQFVSLPGVWSGLGIFANYAYTDSSREELRPLGFDENGERIIGVFDAPFNSDPQHSGTVAVTYTLYGIDASLLYSRQERRLLGFEPNDLSQFEERIDTLDARIEYTGNFGFGDVRFFVEGDDLLRSGEDAFIRETIGGQGTAPKYYRGGRWFGGRSITVGVSSTF